MIAAASGPIPVALAARAAFPDTTGLAAGGVTDPLSDVTLRMVPVAALRIDPSYQRRMSKRGLAEIRRILAGFSWPRFGAISVAETGETFAVIDGQHRAIAAHILRIAEVPAVVTVADAAGQAADFLGINTVRSGMQATDRFRARVAAGDADAAAVARMLAHQEIDFDVAPGEPLKPGQTRSVSTIEKLAKRHGHGTVGTALESLLEAQPEIELSSFAIEAAVILTERVIEAEGDLDRMDRVLRDADFDTLKDGAMNMRAAIGGRVGRHGGTLLARDYNKNLKANLI